MLKVSGIYVSPFEVEATLVQHSAVLEAAVIGVNDHHRPDQRPRPLWCWKTVASATEEELKAFVKDKLAPVLQIPRQIRFVKDLPKPPPARSSASKLRDQEKLAP